MMNKKTVYTQITPIPSHIPRQLALDMLHSHGEIIELNPLVIEHHPIKAPQNAAADEYFSVWYEITERIKLVPGMGKMGSSKISFKGVFHDMPWGLQTHVYAPMGIDLRNKWQIRGNQPGEAPETRELGSAAPAEGLYLREDVEIKCNITLVSTVKKDMKAAAKIMVERMVRKAQLLDSGELHAMFENGKLKSVNPALRDSMLNAAASGVPPSPGLPSSSPQPPQSPRFPPQSPRMVSPDVRTQTMMTDRTSNSQQDSHVAPYHVLRQQQEDDRRRTMYGDHPPQGGYNQYQSAYARQSQYGPQHQPPSQGLAIEMLGDTYYQPQQSSHLQPPGNRQSTYSELSGNSPVHTSFNSSGMSERHSSTSSRPSSYAPHNGMPSPGQQGKSFAAELPTHH